MRIQDIIPIAAVFVVSAIVVAIGLDVLDNVDDSFAAGSDAALAVGNATEGLSELAQWYPTIGIVIGAAIVIGILLFAFMSRRGGVSGE